MTPQEFQLVMRAGPLSGKVFELTKDEIQIGRDTTNDIVISDAEVSRHHCRLMRQGNQFLIEDLGSTNGTFLGSQRLTGVLALQPGQTVRLGEAVTFTYEPVSDADATLAKPVKPPAPPRQAAPAPQPRQPARTPPPPSQPRPQPRPARPQAGQPQAQYAARAAEPAAQPMETGERFLDRAIATVRARPILFGCLGLIVLGGCFGLFVLWYVDHYALWCDVLGQTLCEALGRLVY